MVDDTGGSDDDASVKAWLRTWGRFVASADMDAAVELFEDAAVGFGTRAPVAVGLDELVDEQWRRVWPSLVRFAFDVERALVWISGDRRQAVIATTWTSEGPRADGTIGPRDGRATVVLRRGAVTAPWRGAHTHFSLAPDAAG